MEPTNTQIMEAIAGLGQAVSHQLGQLDQRITDLDRSTTGALQSLDQRITDLDRSTVGALQALRSETRSGLRMLASELGSAIGSLAARVDHLEMRVDTLVDSIADLRRDFNSHTHKN